MGKVETAKRMSPWLKMPWISIKLQEGDRKKHGQNGTTMEKVLDLIIARLESYQNARYTNQDNELALMYLKEAKEALKRRGAVYDD